MSISQEKFKEMLKEKGLKVTNQRLLVLQVLAEHGDEHMTAEDIFELVKEDYPEIGLATIYRTVQLLLDMQLVDRIMLDDGCVRYEIGDFLDEQEGHRHHHHHLICTECGSVSAFRDDLLEDLEAYIEKETGFQVTDHELKFYGVCKKCREEKRITEK
ncbi:Fur family transcriptional regulator [Lachnoclostridium sp. An118]|uniref:Fur family transcriptional regulator n=1 Tax=Lachnoclostridium sp. An118 TaxID=1965547 RepID=UPI000B3839CD|nr:Fur family transcriptional regulator [Lachnoclostridium sp. An118]HIX98775.1 transcriptional repressor [Candidatus Dorea intestinigallinarum]HJA43618.1 transcriptional repressor [Candidatus Dorea stercoravium]